MKRESTPRLAIEWHAGQQGYIVVDGRETFYDEDRRLRVFETAQAAAVWAGQHLGRMSEVTKLKPAEPEGEGDQPQLL